MVIHITKSMKLFLGKTRRAFINGVQFLNIGHLTQNFNFPERQGADSMSHQLILDGSNAIYKQWIHKATQGYPIGFIDDNEIRISLKA